jgi:hypothetical protein
MLRLIGSVQLRETIHGYLGLSTYIGHLLDTTLGRDL